MRAGRRGKNRTAFIYLFFCMGGGRGEQDFHFLLLYPFLSWATVCLIKENVQIIRKESWLKQVPGRSGLVGDVCLFKALGAWFCLIDNTASISFVLGCTFLEDGLASPKSLEFMWKLDKAGKREQQSVVGGWQLPCSEMAERETSGPSPALGLCRFLAPPFPLL